jgi:hypothetical protein
MFVLNEGLITEQSQNARSTTTFGQVTKFNPNETLSDTYNADRKEFEGVFSQETR